MEHPHAKLNDLSRCLTPLEPDGTRGHEMSPSSWLVGGIVPGVSQPLKKLAVDEVLLKLLHR